MNSLATKCTSPHAFSQPSATHILKKWLNYNLYLFVQIIFTAFVAIKLIIKSVYVMMLVIASVGSSVVMSTSTGTLATATLSSR